MKTLEINSTCASELSLDEMLLLNGGSVASDVGTVVGYAIGFTLGGVVVLASRLLDLH